MKFEQHLNVHYNATLLLIYLKRYAVQIAYQEKGKSLMIMEILLTDRTPVWSINIENY